jgi:drug/metabolite transporter (DMT)-like permease
MTLLPALLVWQTPMLDLWVWLIFIGVIGTLGQLIVTEAVKLADMTVLMPFDFLKLVWAAFLGIIFFAEVPDLLTWVGGGIVFASSFYIAWREANLRKAKALSPAQRTVPGTSGKQ